MCRSDGRHVFLKGKVQMITYLLSFNADFRLSANRPPLHVRLNCGVFLLLPNLPAYELAKMSDF